MKNINPLQSPSNPANFVVWRHMKMGAYAQLKLKQLSDAKQEATKTDCARFLVELC